MLSPLAQPALVQNGLQPVWLLSRALLSRSPRAAVVLAAAASSGCTVVDGTVLGSRCTRARPEQKSRPALCDLHS